MHTYYFYFLLHIAHIGFASLCQRNGRTQQVVDSLTFVYVGIRS